MDSPNIPLLRNPYNAWTNRIQESINNYNKCPTSIDNEFDTLIRKPNQNSPYNYMPQQLTFKIEI